MPKILMLVLLLIGFCKAVDLKAEAEFKRDRLKEELTNLYLKENSKVPKNEILSKAVKDCFDKQGDVGSVTDKDLAACHYAFIQIVEKNEKVENLYINNIIELGLSYATMSSMVGMTKKADEKEAYELSTMNTLKNVINFADYLLQNNENIKNNPVAIQTLNDYKNIAQGLIKLSLIGACPLFIDDKPVDRKIDSPFICKLRAFDLYEQKQFREAFLNSRLLCDEFKDSAVCFIAGSMYEMGQGVRFDLKQAKKYYGLACDNGEQAGCDGFKRLYYH